MKLSYQGYDEVQIDEGKITVIATNNPTVYKDLILGVKDYNDKVKAYSDDFSLINNNLAFDFDGDALINHDLDKRYKLELVNKITEGLAPHVRTSIEKEARELFTLLQESLFMTDIPLEVSFDGDVKRLLKYANIHLHPSISNDAYGIIESDLKLHIECDDKSCIVFNNLASYMTQEQFRELQYVNNEIGTKILLIEFSDLDKKDYYKNCNYYYIDADFVGWYF